MSALKINILCFNHQIS